MQSFHGFFIYFLKCNFFQIILVDVLGFKKNTCIGISGKRIIFEKHALKKIRSPKISV